jgi:hypothetical protein
MTDLEIIAFIFFIHLSLSLLIFHFTVKKTGRNDRPISVNNTVDSTVCNRSDSQTILVTGEVPFEGK